MENTGEASMQSYPDPTETHAEHNGPFYASNNGPSNNNAGTSTLSATDELRIAAQLAGNDIDVPNNDVPGAEMHDTQNQGESHDLEQYQTEQIQQHLLDHGGLSGAGEQHMPQADAYGPQNGSYMSEDNVTPARKKSKASRACDECRRKKIRCDAKSELGDEQCTNCKRVNSTCQFSRVPMKRGPSKGYIKELADRLHNLESHVHVPSDVPYAPMQSTLRGSSHDFGETSLENDPNNRKRGFSAISNDTGAYQARSGNWQPDHSSYRSQFEPNGMAPQPTWRDGPEDSSFGAQALGEHGHPATKLEWDDTVIDSYYLNIHSTFPILPHNKRSLATRIQNCPPILQQAFYETLNAVIGTLNGHPTSQHEFQALQRAANAVLSFPPQDAIRNKPIGIMFLQTLLLLAIEADCHGPSNTNSPGGPSLSMILGATVGLAYSMRLHLNDFNDLAADPDRDSDDKLARRCWCTLVILDRFRASSTASPLMIPDTSVTILAEDQAVLGEAMWNLVRLSIILGHTATVLLTTDRNAQGANLLPVIKTLLDGELQRYRETMSDSLTRNSAPIVFLTFWHLRLLMKSSLQTTDDAERAELINQATPCVSVLAEVRHRSPLDHHFSGLAVMVLRELHGIESTREEAERNLKIMLDIHSSATNWNAAVRESINRTLSNSANSHATTAAQGLQHLADLATAGEAGIAEVAADLRPESVAGPAPSIDVGSIARGGFLNGLTN